MKGIKHFSSPVNLLSQKCSTSESSILTANWQDYLLCNRFLLTPKNLFTTRLHSIRMRTARVSPSMLCAGGGDGGAGGLVPGGVWSRVCLLWGSVYLVQGGVCSGGCTWSREGGLLWGVSAPGGCTWSWGCLLWGDLLKGGVRYSPPVNRMTNRCKNITLPQTSFEAVITKTLRETIRPIL